MRINDVSLIRGEKGNPDVLKIVGENGDYEVDGELLEATLIQAGLMCEFCLDSGEIIEDGNDGEGHITRGTEVRKCQEHGPDRSDEDV